MSAKITDLNNAREENAESQANGAAPEMQAKYAELKAAVKAVSTALEDFMFAQQLAIDLEDYQAAGECSADFSDTIDDLLADNDELLQIISMDEFERLW